MVPRTTGCLDRHDRPGPDDLDDERIRWVSLCVLCTIFPNCPRAKKKDPRFAFEPIPGVERAFHRLIGDYFHRGHRHIRKTSAG